MGANVMPPPQPSEGKGEQGGSRPSSNVRALLAPDSYGAVFVFLIVDYLLLMLLPADAWGRFVSVPFVAATLLMALRTSQVRPRTMRIALTFAGATFFIATVQLIVELVLGNPNARFSGLTYLMLFALLLITPGVIMGRILRHPEVTFRTVVGAVCVYILIGMIFAFAFLTVRYLSGQQFFAQSNTKDPADFLYFSFITMLTVGYGDLTPMGNLGRTLAVLDALLGQIFLITTVARLVSVFTVPERFRRRSDASDQQ